MINTIFKNPVVRFAPSPTGLFHLGSARTALFNFLFAQKHQGKFILRIEDTDRARSEEQYENDILEGLKWLGMPFDDFFRQSERGAIYKKHLEELIGEGKAYFSKEEEGERDEVIRFKNPGKEVVFTDLIRGEIKMNTKDLGDFVIAKDLESPLYHLAVSVDDAEMQVSHIIRGDDGISNTPRQILITEAMGAPRPVYAHIPLLLGSDRSKLSKRHGAVPVSEYRRAEYLSEAMVNFLAFLGWNPGTEQELFTREALAQAFDLRKVGKSGAIFNQEKLDWFNKQYLKNLPNDTVEKRMIEELSAIYKRSEVEEKISKISGVILDKIATFADIQKLGKKGEWDMFFMSPKYENSLFLVNPKERPENENSEAKNEVVEKTAQNIDNIINLLSKTQKEEKREEGFTAPDVKEAVWEYAENMGRGNVLWPMRYALSGRDRSPDPFFLAEVLGREETQKRLQNALKTLQKSL